MNEKIYLISLTQKELKMFIEEFEEMLEDWTEGMILEIGSTIWTKEDVKKTLKKLKDQI